MPKCTESLIMIALTYHSVWSAQAEEIFRNNSFFLMHYNCQSRMSRVTYGLALRSRMPFIIQTISSLVARDSITVTLRTFPNAHTHTHTHILLHDHVYSSVAGLCSRAHTRIRKISLVESLSDILLPSPFRTKLRSEPTNLKWPLHQSAW